ncbi:acyloxyacyl hydrolase [Luteibaculum oceani]|nr:acyloxyacyl hydrolase [Luteibaculum oceani]
MLKALLGLLFVVTLGMNAQAQWAEFKVGRGFLIPHRTDMVHLPKSANTKLSFTVWDLKERNWKKSFHGAKIGYEAHFIDLGNKELLGTAWSFNYKVSLPLSRRKYPLTFILGGGPAWLTNKYHVEKNPKNLAIGSHINASLFLQIQKSFAVGPHLVSLGIDLNHYSNAATSKPNLGLNIPSFNLGFVLNGNTDKITPTEKSVNAHHPASWAITVDGGIKELSILDQNKYLVGNIELRRNFKSARNINWELGVLTGYNQSIGAYIENDFDLESGRVKRQVKNPNIQFGPFLGGRLNFGKTSLFFHTGIYAYSKQREIKAMFHRTGIQHMINDKIGLTILMKTHEAKAEHLGIGLTLNLASTK